MDIYVRVVVERYRAIFFDKVLYKRIDFEKRKLDVFRNDRILIISNN